MAFGDFTIPVTQAAWAFWIFAAVFLIAALVSFTRGKKSKVLMMNKTFAGVLFVVVAIFLFAWQQGYLESSTGLTPLSSVQVPSQPSTPAGANVASGGESYQPTASYATKDKFATTSISGTSYYKVGNEAAGTVAKTNVRVGGTYTYWVSNSTYYVQPKTFIAHEGANDITADAWQNTTTTLTAYDTVGHATSSAGLSNCSMGANDQCNIEFTYQGTAKNSASPFGGVMVIEYNNTLSSVTCTGDQLLTENPYHLTYKVASIENTYRVLAYSSSMDDGSGNTRTISCQFKNGATAAGAGSPYYVKFIPANYYLTNDGNIVLDTEKFKNDDTTRTNLGGALTLTSYWAA